MLFIPLLVLLIQKTPLRLSQFLRCSLEMTSYRITCSKTFNWSMLPYSSVPTILYIPPQYHSPDVRTHVKREKKHGQQSSCTPTQAGQRMPSSHCFLSYRENTDTDFFLFSQHQIFRQLTGTIKFNAPSPVKMYLKPANRPQIKEEQSVWSDRLILKRIWLKGVKKLLCPFWSPWVS